MENRANYGSVANNGCHQLIALATAAAGAILNYQATQVTKKPENEVV